MVEETDEALMERVSEGDESAFSVLVSRHQNLVYGTIAKMIGNRVEAEDLAQEVFIRVYKSAKRYEPRAKFTTWLLTICRNCVFSYGRRQKRRKLFFLSSSDDEEVVDVPDKDASTSREEVVHKELEEAVNQALMKLPEKQRMAIVLRQYQQMDYEEIGKVMKVSLSAVKSLIFRGREELRKTLKLYLKGGV